LRFFCVFLGRSKARDSPFFFGISFSGVGGPANAPRNIDPKRDAALLSDCAFVMTRTILRAFQSAPAEAELIGRILAGYGELEMEFANCLAATLGQHKHDHRTAIRTLFRVRGEDSRILIGDAIMRARYTDVGLEDAYNEMLGAIRYCKSIRNQYAHCHWLFEKNKGLFFTRADKPALSAIGALSFTFRHIGVPVLLKQEEYFCYTDDWLSYLQWDYLKRVRKERLPSIPVFEAPKIIPQPPRHSLPGTYTPLHTDQDDEPLPTELSPEDH